MADFPAVYFVPPPPETYVVDTIAATITPTPCTPAPPATLLTNRVWYVPGGFEVRWQTASPDTSGASYPGPGTFGVDTTNFTVDDPSNVS
jgi:hypothetical protein